MSSFPQRSPTRFPTRQPTPNPTRQPTKRPTRPPTKRPTALPTRSPTLFPTRAPTKLPTKLPSASPVNEVEEDPTPSPTECVDVKFKAKAKKDFCKWMRKKQNRIDTWCVEGKSLKDNLVQNMCPVSCGLCLPPPPPVCETSGSDRSDYRKNGDSTKTCEWIDSLKPSSKKKKCNSKQDGLKVRDYWCPETCREYRKCVVCEDVPEFASNGDPNKNCGWLALWSAEERKSRCRGLQDGFSIAFYWCPATCAGEFGSGC